MEPPSPILTELRNAADQTSDDPLSHNIYMIMGDATGEDRDGIYVCAWSARNGLSYIGPAGKEIS